MGKIEVISGGGAKGSGLSGQYYAGNQLGIKVEHYFGTSVGSIGGFCKIFNSPSKYLELLNNTNLQKLTNGYLGGKIQGDGKPLEDLLIKTQYESYQKHLDLLNNPSSAKLDNAESEKLQEIQKKLNSNTQQAFTFAEHAVMKKIWPDYADLTVVAIRSDTNEDYIFSSIEQTNALKVWLKDHSTLNDKLKKLNDTIIQYDNYKFSQNDLENIKEVDDTKQFFRNDKGDIFLDINMSDAVIASSSLPIVFRQRRIGSYYFKDGGLHNNLPSNLVENNTDILVVSYDRPGLIKALTNPTTVSLPQLRYLLARIFYFFGWIPDKPEALRQNFQQDMEKTIKAVKSQQAIICNTYGIETTDFSKAHKQKDELFLRFYFDTMINYALKNSDNQFLNNITSDQKNSLSVLNFVFRTLDYSGISRTNSGYQDIIKKLVEIVTKDENSLEHLSDPQKITEEILQVVKNNEKCLKLLRQNAAIKEAHKAGKQGKQTSKYDLLYEAIDTCDKMQYQNLLSKAKKATIYKKPCQNKKSFAAAYKEEKNRKDLAKNQPGEKILSLKS